MGFSNRRNYVGPRGPMPGQKSIRLAKKGSGSSFLDAGFRRLQLGHPFPPASLCGKERGGIGKDCSRPFLASAPALLPGQREGRSKRPTKLEMILNLFLVLIIEGENF